MYNKKLWVGVIFLLMYFESRRSNNPGEFANVFADAGERMSWIDDVDGVL